MKKIIQLKNETINFSKNIVFDISQTNFKIGAIKFKKIFWEVELRNYNKYDHSIELRLINEFPSNTSRFNSQSLNNKINNLIFKDLQWNQLDRASWYHQRSELLNVLSLTCRKSIENNTYPYHIGNSIYQNNTKERSKAYSTAFQKEISLEDRFSLKDLHKPIYSEISRKHSFNINVKYKDIEFHLGHIQTNYKFNFHPITVSLKVYNHNLLSEFEYIKNYFPKALNTKNSINISGIIEIKDFEIVSITAQSKEIDLINKSIINEIKTTIINKSIKSHRDKVDKNILVSADEIYLRVHKSLINSGILDRYGKDIIDFIVEHREIKHKKQLKYLADIIHCNNEKIYFTLKPNFGFLFQFQNKDSIYYLYELLDSHATYVWYFPITLSASNYFIIIEKEIETISSFGRNWYKKDYKENHSTKDFIFEYINHNNNIDYNAWLDKLNKIIN